MINPATFILMVIIGGSPPGGPPQVSSILPEVVREPQESGTEGGLTVSG